MEMGISKSIIMEQVQPLNALQNDFASNTILHMFS